MPEHHSVGTQPVFNTTFKNHGNTVTMTKLLKKSFNIISDPPSLLTVNYLISNFTSSIENGWLIFSFVDVFNKRGTDSSKGGALFNFLKRSIKSENSIEEVS